MVHFSDWLIFAVACFALVITPGPNMIYLISRSITQGRQAGVISLTGVICGFMFHIILVAYGLTAILFAVPYTFMILKIAGAAYLLYMAYNAIKPGGKNIFETGGDLRRDTPARLFMMGFLTNVLNPKMAMFYLSLFPQFIKIELGAVATQCFQLGFTQMAISFTVNFFIVISAAKVANWFSQNPSWIKIQKWFMASILAFLAVKMAITKQN